MFGKGVKTLTDLFDFQPVEKRYPPQCSLPGCHLPRYVENGWLVHDFCGRKHANAYKAMKEEEERQKWSKRQHNGGGRGSGVDASPKQQRFNYSGVVGGQSQTHHAYYGHGMNIPKRSECGVIRFYNKFDGYYQFTNFYLYAPIVLDEKAWPTTEHYFQAQKFVGTPYVEVIRNSDSPREAFDLSRNPAVSRWRRKDWEDVKVDIMRKALLAKFTQHRDLRQLLLRTEGDYLIEHTPHDKFWGNGGDDKGRNQLGLLLMELRSELQLYLNMNVSSPVITKQPLGRGRGNELERSRVGTDQGGQFTEEGEGSRSSSPHRGLRQDVDLENDGMSESPTTATNTESTEDTQTIKTTKFVDDLIDLSENDPEESVAKESCVSSSAPEASLGGDIGLLMTAEDIESIPGLSAVLQRTVTSTISQASESEGEVLTTAVELNVGQPVQATEDSTNYPTDITSLPVGTASSPLTPAETTQGGEPKGSTVEDNSMEVTTIEQTEQGGDNEISAMEMETQKQDEEDTQMEHE